MADDGASSAAALLKVALDHHQANRLDEAEACYLAILKSYPDFAPAWINLGVLMRRQGQLDAAALYLKHSVGLLPEDGRCWSNLGNALRDLGQLEEAEHAHKQSLALSPDSPETHYNLGLCLRERGDIAAAITSFETAAAKGYDKPDLAWDMALTLLLSGDLKQGFAQYEARWMLPQSPPQHQDIPGWDGDDLDGTLLVYAEQGFGDSIQFCRYLPLLRGRAKRIVFECQPPLYRLLRASPALAGIDIAARQHEALPRADAAVALLSLPRFCGTVDDRTIPADIPYLMPPTTNIPALAAEKRHRRVGLAWAGKPSHNNDRNRSLPLSSLSPLLDCPDTDFFSFQMGAAASQIAALHLSPLLPDLSPHIRDFADTAALIRDMDLIITVDTSIAHLTGALGKPVWVILPHAPDWRWQLGRDDSPWYPTMTLFRQEKPGDRDGAVRRVRDQLTAF